MIIEEDGIIEPSDQGTITTERTDEFVNSLDERLATIVDRLDAMKLDDPTEGNQ